MRLSVDLSVDTVRGAVRQPRAMTAACRYRIVLHDGGDVSDWRALAGVFEICRPVNNSPRRNNVSMKSAAAVNLRDPKSRDIFHTQKIYRLTAPKTEPSAVPCVR